MPHSRFRCPACGVEEEAPDEVAARSWLAGQTLPCGHGDAEFLPFHPIPQEADAPFVRLSSRRKEKTPETDGANPASASVDEPSHVL